MKLAGQEHRVQWTAPAPMWTGVRGAAPAGPALLTFRSDAFMEELIALLATDPARLWDRVARPESFREPVGAPAGRAPVTTGQLKLYQPVHGQFALVAASLVCQVPGLPDRTVRRPAETVGFVIRKRDRGAEYALLPGPPKAWREITSGNEKLLDKDEELLPLFPLTYTEQTRRCLYFGVIPTSAREALQAATDRAAPAPDAAARLDEFRRRVIDPWRTIQVPGTLVVEQSMFLLLDFAQLLKAGNVLPDAEPPASETATLRARLYNTTFGTNGPRLIDALRQVSDEWDRVTGESQDPPSRTFNVLDLQPSLKTQGELDDLTARLKAVLDAVTPASTGTASAPAPADGPQYVVRCVYARPACRPPNDKVVSPASAPFTIAPFFDPDAPARPLNIALPVDTSVKGLRKFVRSVGFRTSAGLRKQICSVSDFAEALKGNTKGGCDEPNAAVVWRFSLPIITLCAFVMLIAMVTVLNIAFWWLPFFRTAEVVEE